MTIVAFRVRLVTDASVAIRTALPTVSGRPVVTWLVPPDHAPAQPVPPLFPARLPLSYEKSSEKMTSARACAAQRAKAVATGTLSAKVPAVMTMERSVRNGG